jgi:2-keto-3-deoxy-L-rhamnonate aldolase RhmA
MRTGPLSAYQIQDAIYMKPRGRRRPGGPENHWVQHVNYETWKSEVEDDFIILPQIESIAGLNNADAIAANPITTAMAVGRYDLSADLDVCWDADSDELQQALKKSKKRGEPPKKHVDDWRLSDDCEAWL